VHVRLVLSVARVQGEHAHTGQYMFPYNNLIVDVEEGLLELLDLIPTALWMDPSFLFQCQNKR